jgi:hypothetical protein
MDFKLPVVILREAGILRMNQLCRKLRSAVICEVKLQQDWQVTSSLINTPHSWMIKDLNLCFRD